MEKTKSFKYDRTFINSLIFEEKKTDISKVSYSFKIEPQFESEDSDFMRIIAVFSLFDAATNENILELIQTSYFILEDDLEIFDIKRDMEFRMAEICYEEITSQTRMILKDTESYRELTMELSFRELYENVPNEMNGAEENNEN